MDFEDLYFTLEKVLGDVEISIPIMPNFNLDNVVEGSFYLAIKSRPKQEFVKQMVRQYLADKEAQGRKIRLVVILPHAEKGNFDSPVAARTENMFYDSFPEDINGAIIYCIESNVFDALYGKSLTRSKEAALC